MPVMKQLRIGSVNYDTVGSASVTQTVTSGTEIATVTIDGTATKLYAPTYTLPTASTSTLGGVKVDGSTITADANGVISATSSGGGGSGYDYRIDVTISNSTVTADFNGASLTEIATAVTDDPATNVVIVVVVDDYTTRGIITYSSYNTSWGDVASNIEFVSFYYDNADDKFFIRRTSLAGDGYSTTQSRCA